MESTPERDSRQARGAWSNWRRWAILLGALILFVVVFGLLERLVEPGARPGPAVASDPVTPLGPIRPEVTKLGRSGVRVVLGSYRMTQNYHDEAKADRLIACIEQASRRHRPSPKAKPDVLPRRTTRSPGTLA